MREIASQFQTCLDPSIFSPVVKMTSIREILGLAAKLDLKIELLDVKTTFLHGYMEQPKGGRS